MQELRANVTADLDHLGATLKSKDERKGENFSL